MYKRKNMRPSHRYSFRASPTTSKMTDDAKSTWYPTVSVALSSGSVANSPGIPTATRILNAFEPKIFPIASESLLFCKDLIETTSSGSEVPSANAEIVITSAGILSNCAPVTTESTTYFAPSKSPASPIKRKMYGFTML